MKLLMYILIACLLTIGSLRFIQAQSTETIQIYGVIRPNSSGTWYLFNDSQHEPQNIASISQTSAEVRVYYSQTCSEIHRASVGPDETLAINDIIPGPSVGLSYTAVWFGEDGVHINPNTITNGNANIWFSVECEI